MRRRAKGHEAEVMELSIGLKSTRQRSDPPPTLGSKHTLEQENEEEGRTRWVGNLCKKGGRLLFCGEPTQEKRRQCDDDRKKLVVRGRCEHV